MPREPGITLHPKLGVNPKLTVCPRCGGDGDELMLIGTRTAIFRCASCLVNIYGHGLREPCPKCGSTGPHQEVGTIEEHDRLPATQPCAKCRAELAEHAAIVAAGGVYWKCSKCGSAGVICPSPYAEHVRKTGGVAAPAPCGVDFEGEEECPICHPKPQEGPTT